MLRRSATMSLGGSPWSCAPTFRSIGWTDGIRAGPDLRPTFYPGGIPALPEAVVELGRLLLERIDDLDEKIDGLDRRFRASARENRGRTKRRRG